MSSESTYGPFLRFVLAIAGATVAVMIAAITLLLMANATGRYSGLFSLVWVEEVARALFIWVSFIGGGIAVAHNGHFRLDLIDGMLPQFGKRVAQFAAHASMVLLGVGLVVTGALMVFDSVGQYTTALNLPIPIIYLSIPISGLIFITYAVGHCIDILRHRRVTGRAT